MNMKKNMTLNEEIINGYTIETVNPEDGEVKLWGMPHGEKLTFINVLQVLTNFGWEYGDNLFIHVNGSLADIHLTLTDCPLATISANLADSFREEDYAVFFKESSARK